MNSIKQSMWYLITYSKVFLIVLSVFIVFAFMINIKSSLSFIESKGLLINLFVFLGIYLGGALAKLKRSYLWKNNKNYKNSLLNAYLIIIGVIYLCFVPFLWKFINISPFIIAMPFCISIFASHIVLGKNLLYKILIPSFPIIITQLKVLGLSFNNILLLIFIATSLLIISMYKNIFYQYSNHKSKERTDKENTTAFMTTGFNQKQLDKINGFIGDVISNWIIHGKKNLGWAVLMPHTRLAIITFVYSLILMVFIYLMDPKMQNLIGVFVLMMLPNIFLGFVMESKNLLKQVKIFAHVFNGEKHRELKNKTLIALDKNLIVNSFVLVAMTVLFIKILSINILISPLLMSFAFIIGLSLAICPLLMCLNWINISPALIIILFSYATILYKSIKWMHDDLLVSMSPMYIIGFIVSCVVMRFITQYIFWQRPMESLLKNH